MRYYERKKNGMKVDTVHKSKEEHQVESVKFSLIQEYDSTLWSSIDLCLFATE